MHNNKSTFTILAGMAIVILIGVIGLRVATLVSQINVYISRGVLGFATIYFLFREIALANKGEPIDVVYTFPKNVKYVLMFFGSYLIFFWGLNEVLELLFFIIRYLRSSGGW